MINYFDEDELDRANADLENFQVSERYLKPYKKLIKGIKCPVHKRVAKIDQACQYERYKDGNYTRLYFSYTCCSGFESHIIKILDSHVVDYSFHRVYRHDEV